MNKVLFEFEDKSWFPGFLRKYMTDYLQFLFNNLNLYRPTIHILQKLLHDQDNYNIVDLCSGSGGPLFRIKKKLTQLSGKQVGVTLTDKYVPDNIDNILPQGITYDKRSIDPKNVPDDLKGIRTMFSSIHHFTFTELTEILYDAVKKKQPVVFSDSGDKNFLFIIAIIILHPVLLIILTPFIRPFEFKRFLFTYLIPLIIIFAIWDGIVSVMNLYNGRTLKFVTKQTHLQEFNWKLIKHRNLFGMKIYTLIGKP